MLVAMEQLTITTLRNVVGSMTLEETLTSRDQINSQLRSVLDEATEKWGVRVTRVELKSIDPPRTIQEAMEQQMRADRAKRAAVLQAEGEKQSAILRAEGLRQAAILNAEADQQANVLRAEGEKQARALRAAGRGRGAGQDLRRPSARPGSRRRTCSGTSTSRRCPQVAAGDANKLLLLPDRRGRCDGSGGRPRRGLQRGRNGRRRKPAPAPHAARLTPAPPDRVVAGRRPDGPVSLVECAASRERAHAPTAPACPGRVHGGGGARPPGGAGDGRHGHASSTRPGPAANAIDDIYRAVLGVTVTIFVLVGGWLLYSALRFRVRPGDPDIEPPQVRGSTRLEIGWTLAPVLVLAALAGYTIDNIPAVKDAPVGRDRGQRAGAAVLVLLRLRPTPASAARRRAAAALVVPENTAVKLDVNSKDVDHDWWVPALGPEDRRDPRPDEHDLVQGRPARARTTASAPSSAASATPPC